MKITKNIRSILIKKDAAYRPVSYPSLRGIRMPDGISLFESNGKTYIVTANEGDSREWNEYLNEAECNFGKGQTSPSGKLRLKTVD